MIDAKCPSCGSPISVFARIDRGVITCKGCGCKYAVRYRKRYQRFLVEWVLAAGMLIGLAALIYLSEIHDWFLLIGAFVAIGIVYLVPRTRYYVEVDTDDA